MPLTLPYAEGVWTPSLLFGGAAVGMTYGTQLGRYTRIGRMVIAEGYMLLTAKGSSVGAASVAGLPLPINAAQPFGVADVYFNAMAASIANVVALATPGSGTALTMQQLTAGGAVGLIQTDFTNTSALAFTAIYAV